MPTALREQEGTVGHNPNADEPIFPALDKIPDAPVFLNRWAKVEWKHVTPDLWSMGMLANCDVSALAAYCQAYGRWRMAEEGLTRYAKTKAGKKHPLLLETKAGNMIQHPLVGIANKAYRDMVRLAAEFGLTPSARTQIEAKRGQNADPLAAKYGID